MPLATSTARAKAGEQQTFPDSQALAAVDDIESLTNGLSRKIWQKIMILDRYMDRS